MSKAVWILREAARPLGEEIAESLNASLETAPSGENREGFRRCYRERSGWVIVGASGVAVRYLDGLLESKLSDPAVVVIDEAARFVIPLVGGHEGGANDLAYAVARITGATPVVTTATEALKPLVVGVGCRKGVSSGQIEAAVCAALPEGRLVEDIREVVTVDRKADEVGLLDWAAGHGLPLRIVASDQIAGRAWVTKPSEWVQKNLGLPGVCEPAALIAAPRGKLIVPKINTDGVSVAVVEDFTKEQPEAQPTAIGKGMLSLVSLGPGNLDLIPPRARAAISRSSDVVGYGLYMDLIQPWLAGKAQHRMPLTQEKARAEKAIELARDGCQVALVSSGDIGIYAMATLVFELLDTGCEIDLEIIPGITAATSCAALLGAPLAHDFATLSLSDLLCPWDWIERRARSIAEADLAVVLYNVQSKARPTGVRRIIEIMLENKRPDTVCGIVRNAYRDGQDIQVCSLEDLRGREFDMLTTVVIGNRFTRRNSFGVYSPRGYLDWDEAHSPAQVPEEAVWVFSGTSDGNALARRIAEAGHEVVVSVSTDYGVEVAKRSLGSCATVIKGSVGSDGRRAWFEKSKARSVVDATHPFAQQISEDLVGLCEGSNIPYIRYERPADDLSLEGLSGESDFESAIDRAIGVGKRIFLATGAKELGKVREHPRWKEAEWFVRLAPDPASLEKSLESGIPRGNLCFMQGPFSADFNRSQWEGWGIDCVVTRESGVGSGLAEKLEAARSLSIPVIVIRRPVATGVKSVGDADAILDLLGTTGSSNAR